MQYWGMILSQRHKDRLHENSDLNISVLQKYICTIQTRSVVYLLRT